MLVQLAAASVVRIWTTLAAAKRTIMTNTCCCVYSVEILLMMDNGPVRNIYSTLSNKFEKLRISMAFIIRTINKVHKKGGLKKLRQKNCVHLCLITGIPQNVKT